MALKERLLDVPVVGTGMRVQQRYKDDAGNQFAAAIAFFGFLSLFPLVLIALATVGFVLADDPVRQADLVAAITEAIPGFGATLGEGDTQIAAALEATIEQRETIGAVALLLLLFSGLRVVDAGMTATARVARRDIDANPVALRVRQITALAVLGVAALAGAVASSAVGFEAEGAVALVLSAGGAAVSFLFDVALFGGAYRMLCPPPRPGLRRVLPGAVLGAVGWTGLKFAGAAYIGRQVASTNALYGALGGVIGLLLLLFLAGRLYLYGAELNEVLAARRARGAEPDRAGTTPAGGAEPDRVRVPTAGGAAAGARDGWDAGAYRAHSSLQTREAERLLDALAPRQGEIVLDIGCGDGRVTAGIAAAGARAVGLDRSASMAAAAAGAGVDAVVGDAAALPFAPACFDGVFSNAALHWVGDQERALRGIARVLRPGGRFVARVGATGNQWRLGVELLRLLAEPPYAAHRPAGFRPPWTMAEPSEWAAVLLDAGMDLRRFEVEPSQADWQDRADVRGWLASVSGGIVGLLPADLRDRFLDEAVDRTWARADAEDAATGLARAFVRLEVHAVKR